MISSSVPACLLVIGGGVPSQERGVLDSAECFRDCGDSLEPQAAWLPLPVPVRGATAHFDAANRLVYVVGGCSGPKQHVADIQVFDLERQQWSLSALRLRKERSCHCIVALGASRLVVIGGYDGY